MAVQRRSLWWIRLDNNIKIVKENQGPVDKLLSEWLSSHFMVLVIGIVILLFPVQRNQLHCSSETRKLRERRPKFSFFHHRAVFDASVNHMVYCLQKWLQEYLLLIANTNTNQHTHEQDRLAHPASAEPLSWTEDRRQLGRDHPDWSRLVILYISILFNFIFCCHFSELHLSGLDLKCKLF